MRSTKALRISPVGLRGIVGAGMSAGHAIDFASAFGTLLGPDDSRKSNAIVLGRDPRASGVMLRQGVIAGLLACGCDVIDLGIAPTPVVQHAIGHFDAAGGISIGASHNNAEWNALKFFGRSGVYLSTAEASELLDIYHLKKFAFVGWDRVGKVRMDPDAIDRYLDDLAQHYDLAALASLRVVVDCCNGTSSLILRRANERFGTSFILINEKLEGVAFAHAPSTTRDTVGLQLAPLMRPLMADAGFLFDVDSDRVALASEDGTAVSEEMVLPLLADYLLPRGPGKLVITNLSTTALIEHVAARHGGRVLRVPVGRQAAADALSTYQPRQIALAGEGTGAVMMPQFRFVYDGIASMLAILSMMRERGQKLSEILAEYPRYSILKAQLPLVTRHIPALLAELRDRHSDGRPNSADGLRVDWPDRWFHVRVSQTEPVIRVICEQRGAPPVELFDSLIATVRSYS
jgi:phosphomannomutase